ncbi:flagellin [Roseococcus sp. DSY-14]|uniref:flagellin N-terminal helical domain-containing protein n=1 Tax=Roseococcus sp. DSY-14 TaxID=3369650 RepID=UPI00387A928C
MSDMIGRLTAETSSLRLRLEALTRQVASGQRTERLGDIAPEVPRAVSLRAEMGRRDTYTRAMDQAGARMEVTQGALDRLRGIAREFRTEVAMRVEAGRPDSLATVAGRARAALAEVGALLNTRHAGEYLFAGTDIARPPVPSPEGLAAGPMAAAIAAEVAALAPGNAAAVAAQTIAVAQADDTPFSAAAADPAAPRRAVPAGDGELVAYGLHAARNTEAASTGETTGAWARDLLRNLMVLAALEPAQAAAAPDDFDALVGSVRQGLAAAEDSLGEEAGALGLVQARVAAAQERHARVTDTLKVQLAGIQEVDLAATMTRLQATQSALEASFRAIASISGLSLAKFLG